MSPALVTGLIAVLALPFAVGDLTPPVGPVSPTMRSLAEVEPRTPVATLPGDGTAVHVISAPGSYYLTADVVGVSGKSGIAIRADDVTLDLSGFAVRGVTGALFGVFVESAGKGLIVRNGHAIGWPLDGFALATADGLVAEDLVARGNGGVGIHAGENSVVTRCVAQSNATGFRVFSPSGLTDCSAMQNTGTGIVLIGVSKFGGSVTNCTAYGNLTGIAVDSWGATIAGNSATSNTGHGISVEGGATGCVIARNTCSRNGSGAGIGAGIHLSTTDHRVEDNQLSSADFGLQSTVGGNFIVRNTTAGNTVNYSLAGTNTVGPIVTATGVIASTSPYANFEF